MRTISVGDLHGNDDWQRIRPDNYDIIIFLGDYLDSAFVEDTEMLNNLDEITAFRKAYPDKVKLLLGNHEISYLFPAYRATGFRHYIARQVQTRLKKNAHLFQVAFQYKNYLWTHAGIQSEYYLQKILPQVRETDENLASTLNRLYKEKYSPLFEVGPERGGGRNATGGPFWLHSTRLLENPLKGYHQIVGHTPVETIQHVNPFENDNDTSVTLCDCIVYGNRKFYKMIC
jgi:predicted MPP superfamily phosphohydrolase